MKKIIIANWKMNPGTFREAISLARGTEMGLSKARGVEAVIAPPALFLISVLKVLKKSKIGAQNTFFEKGGAYTGEISVSQLKSFGVKYIICGHSERRALGETDEIVHKKVKAVLTAGLKAVLCIGEREKKKDVAFPPVVREELRSAIRNISKNNLKNLVVAYEPVWAIGTGRAETPKGVFEMSTLIRRELHGILGKKIALQIPVLYGGSVDDVNAADFVSQGRVDGLLVGGASLNSKKFSEIARRVSLL